MVLWRRTSTLRSGPAALSAWSELLWRLDAWCKKSMHNHRNTDTQKHQFA